MRFKQAATFLLVETWQQMSLSTARVGLVMNGSLGLVFDLPIKALNHLNSTKGSLLMRSILSIFFRASVKTIEHDGVEHAGYMAFLALLSLFPSVIFFLICTKLIGASQIGEALVAWLLNNLPYNTTGAIRPHIEHLRRVPAQSLMGLALVGGVWTSSSFIEGVRTILNRIYEVRTPPRYLMRRLLSFVQFLLIGVSIFFTITFLVIMPAMVNLYLIIMPGTLEKVPALNSAITFMSPAWQHLAYVIGFFVLFMMTSLIYYIVPNVKLSLTKVLPGAMVTVFLWIIAGRLLSSWVVYYSQLSLIYGSLGSIIVVLMLFYISNLIFIYGAELNYLLSKKEEEH